MRGQLWTAVREREEKKKKRVRVRERERETVNYPFFFCVKKTLVETSFPVKYSHSISPY